MAWDVKAVESRNVAFGQGALRYGLFGYGGQGAEAFGGAWRVQVGQGGHGMVGHRMLFRGWSRRSQ